MYAEAAERHHLTKDQDIMDLKGLFNDLKICLEAQFELTKEQMVHANALHLMYIFNSTCQINICKAANNAIYQVTHTTFITMHVEIMVRRAAHIVLCF
jgi:hypothetical protein